MFKSTWIVILCSAMLMAYSAYAGEASARATFDRLQQAYRQKNVEQWRTCLSAASLKMDEKIHQIPTGAQADGSRASIDYNFPTDVEFVGERQEGDRVIVSCLEKRPPKDPMRSDAKSEYVFIKEAGDWKFDISATMERAMSALSSANGK